MRESKDQYYTKMLPLVCGRSTCARRSVGAIITDERGITLSMGYNGTPHGFEHCYPDKRCAGADDPPGDNSRCMAVHAEQNAFLQCHRLDLAHTMYVTCCPCFVCAKLVLQTFIKRVVICGPYSTTDGETLLRNQRLLYFYDYESNVARLIEPISRW